MRIIDRYILGTFLKNYLISFMVLVGLYIVLDMVFNFADFAVFQSRTGGGAFASTLLLIRGVGSYYFHQMFLFFAHLSGIIPVVAAAFTLFRLSRNNELTALLAAGVPLLRVAMPIILAAVGLNVLLLVDQELIIPRIIPQLMRKHGQLHMESGPSFPIQAMQDADGAILNAGLYLPPDRNSTARMEEVDIIYRDEQLQPVSLLSAKRAIWNESRQEWDLVNGRVIHGLRPDERRSDPVPVAAYGSNITPHEIALFRRGDSVQLLSTAQINELLERDRLYGQTDLLRVKHMRFTQPLANVILLLLAIPSVLTREPSRLRSAAAQCLVLVGLAMGSIFLSHQLAGTPPVGWGESWPALMAWMPILIFGPISIWLMDRVKT